MDHELKSMSNTLVIVPLQEPYSSMCIFFEGTQETPEK